MIQAVPVATVSCDALNLGAPFLLLGVARMARMNISSGAKWESIVGYSRAVRVGPFVYVAGTTALDRSTGKVVGGEDPYAQTVQALRNIESALREAGTGIRDVVRTRIFTTDISHWESIGRAHRAVFGEIRPATTMIEVRRLIQPEMLVEIEADATLADDSRERTGTRRSESLNMA